ncbi:hypothetical protein NEDG_01847 [Nematocida displodere]|uniref:Uncharacterized protein n=1 Tax=Nematocida displodere TaxID=1805483 RepID=A0A177EK58_9MICR|nr:hypothetical protein NEDG_01847 [Nematocida displodere]
MDAYKVSRGDTFADHGVCVSKAEVWQEGNTTTTTTPPQPGCIPNRKRHSRDPLLMLCIEIFIGAILVRCFDAESTQALGGTDLIAQPDTYAHIVSPYTAETVAFFKSCGAELCTITIGTQKHILRAQGKAGHDIRLYKATLAEIPKKLVDGMVFTSLGIITKRSGDARQSDLSSPRVSKDMLAKLFTGFGNVYANSLRVVGGLAVGCCALDSIFARIVVQKVSLVGMNGDDIGWMFAHNDFRECDLALVVRGSSTIETLGFMDMLQCRNLLEVSLECLPRLRHMDCEMLESGRVQDSLSIGFSLEHVALSQKVLHGIANKGWKCLSIPKLLCDKLKRTYNSVYVIEKLFIWFDRLEDVNSLADFRPPTVPEKKLSVKIVIAEFRIEETFLTIRLVKAFANWVGLVMKGVLSFNMHVASQFRVHNWLKKTDFVLCNSPDLQLVRVDKALCVVSDPNNNPNNFILYIPATLYPDWVSGALGQNWCPASVDLAKKIAQTRPLLFSPEDEDMVVRPHACLSCKKPFFTMATQKDVQMLVCFFTAWNYSICNICLSELYFQARTSLTPICFPGTSYTLRRTPKQKYMVKQESKLSKPRYYLAGGEEENLVIRTSPSNPVVDYDPVVSYSLGLYDSEHE